jgi:hypothetical protein
MLISISIFRAVFTYVISRLQVKPQYPWALPFLSMNIYLEFVLTPVNDLPVLVTKQRVMTRGTFWSKQKAYIYEFCWSPDPVFPLHRYAVGLLFVLSRKWLSNCVCSPTTYYPTSGLRNPPPHSLRGVEAPRNVQNMWVLSDWIPFFW